MSEETARPRPWIVMVGGFLGSGKTTLILAAARLLEQRGVRCAVILNDQSNDLVDSRHAEAEGFLAREVTGGCFCCRLSELMSVIEHLQTYRPAVIFAEPVGSCTDISATVLGPLLECFDRYRVAPFTVLVDPARAAALLATDADSDMAFLFEKQLHEADLVCMTKADLYPDAAGIPGLDTRRLSAKTGQGVQPWLDEILLGSQEVGRTTLEIDNGRYAQAEAALAWLNLSCNLVPAVPLSPALIIGPLIDRLDMALTAAAIPIVHLKVFDRSATGWLKAAVCANGEEPKVEGNLDASPAGRHELVVNLRAKGDPEVVRRTVEEQLRPIEGQVLDVHLECFSPAPPMPERRVARSRI
jgi:Ni2+-binding GTPase involved in maturation of urease and hydrogenase